MGLPSPAEQLAALHPPRGKAPLWETTLRDHRKRLGLTLAVASEALGISLGYLSQLEKGVNDPSHLLARKIADFYGVAVEVLWVRRVGAEGSIGEGRGA